MYAVKKNLQYGVINIIPKTQPGYIYIYILIYIAGTEWAGYFPPPDIGYLFYALSTTSSAA